MGWVLLLVLAGIAALPWVAERRRHKIGKADRRNAPGQFADLSAGLTHYQWLGPIRGPVAVCVHGLTSPSGVWRGLAQELAQMGFRVLVYDLYGRGLSDAPRGPQTTAFHVTQLRELMQHEGLDEEVTLIGYSMGGAIAAAFAAEEEHRLRRLILLAPAGMGHNLGPLVHWVVEWPYIGDWAFHMFWPRQFRAGIAEEEGAPTTIPDIWAVQRGELERSGFLPSVLSSLRGTLRRPVEQAHLALAQTELPILAIWGGDDPIIPPLAMGQLTQWNRKVRHEVIDGAGHGLGYTHTAEVADVIRSAVTQAD